MVENQWVVEPFSKQRHDRGSFDCGNSLLNDWLLTKANQFEKRDLARTYVLLENEQNREAVRGNYALSNHTIVFEALPEDQAKGLPQIDVPAVLIGRLAIDSTLQGQGLGEFLLLDALRRIQCLSSKIGIQAVEVDAIDTSAVRFYQKYGFLSLRDDSQHLFLPMKVIRKLKFPP